MKLKEKLFIGKDDEKMKDKNRIKPFLEEFGKLWSRVPDCRFCQLVINVAKVDDPFYMEDEKFLEKLNEMKGEK